MCAILNQGFILEDNIMTIDITNNGASYVVAVAGRLDTVTAPELEARLKVLYDSVKELTFDFSALEYISSAGLRVLLGAQKVMNKVGTMTVKNVDSAVMEVFEITGFKDILNIE